MNPGIRGLTTQFAQMPRGLLGSPKPIPMPDRAWHPEAIDWATRVTSNGGTISTTVLRAVSDFCAAIDRNSLRDRFYRFNPFAGGNLLGALVPLYQGPAFGGTKYGNPTDTNINFVSADYVDSGANGGIKSNASKYLNTGLPANTIPTNKAHVGIGLVSENTLSGNHSAIGAFSGAQILGIACTSSGRLAGIFGSFSLTSNHCGPSTSGVQLAIGNLLATYPLFYRDGSVVGAQATAFTAYSASNPIFVFGLSTTSVTLTDPVDARIGWYSFGETMTSAQVSAYTAALVSLRAALGR